MLDLLTNFDFITVLVGKAIFNIVRIKQDSTLLQQSKAK